MKSPKYAIDTLTPLTPPKTSLRVQGDEFVEWLGAMTNADAARTLGVTAACVTQWAQSGVTGTAAHLIAFLIAARIPPHVVAQHLEIVLSNFQRSQFERKA